MAEKTITIDNRPEEVDLVREGNYFRAGETEIELVSLRGDEAELRIGGSTQLVPFVIDGTQISFAWQGEIWIAEVTSKGVRARAKHRDHSLSAPMPGVVLKILVAPGDEVTKGAPLLILEAMKMEHPIAAPRDGIVAAIHCREGEMVQPGSDLVTLT